MKKFFAAVMVVLVVTAACLTLCACVDGPINISAKLAKCDVKVELETLHDGDSLNINTDIYSVYIYRCEGNVATLAYVSDERCHISAGPAGDNATAINQVQSGTVTMFNKSLHMVIGIPQSWESISLTCQGDAGSICVQHLNATDVRLECAAGSIFFEGSGNKIYAKASTGSIKIEGEFQTEVIAHAATGSIEVEVDTEYLSLIAETGSVKFESDASVIEVEVGTGSITGTIEGEKALYEITAQAESGSCNVSNQKGDGKHSVTLHNKTGSIKLKFEQ